MGQARNRSSAAHTADVTGHGRPGTWCPLGRRTGQTSLHHRARDSARAAQHQPRVGEGLCERWHRADPPTRPRHSMATFAPRCGPEDRPVDAATLAAGDQGGHVHARPALGAAVRSRPDRRPSDGSRSRSARCQPAASVSRCCQRCCQWPDPSRSATRANVRNSLSTGILSAPEGIRTPNPLIRSRSHSVCLVRSG